MYSWDSTSGSPLDRFWFTSGASSLSPISSLNSLPSPHALLLLSWSSTTPDTEVQSARARNWPLSRSTKLCVARAGLEPAAAELMRLAICRLIVPRINSCRIRSLPCDQGRSSRPALHVGPRNRNRTCLQRLSAARPPSRLSEENWCSDEDSNLDMND